MRKHDEIKMPVYIVVLGLLFGVGVLRVSATSLAVAHEHEVHEVEEEVVIEEETESNSMVITKAPLMEVSQESVDYYLPYPGILPDHPMYWLKMVRDKVQLWLTTKTESKAEKLLLYADKRLGAGWALVEGGKVSLGVTTLTKAEKYLEQAMMLSSELDESKTEFREKLSKAARKHQEVIMIINEKVGEEQRQVLEQILVISKTEL